MGTDVRAEARGVWITRAEPGASATAEAVRAMGFEPLVAPLLEVHFLQPDLDLTGVAALAFTSANGVRAFAALRDERRFPVFAVGETTGEAARVAWFADVTSADGDASALARLITRIGVNGLVLHPTALEPAADLAGDLRSVGIEARAVAVYATREAQTLSPDVFAALRAGRLAAILIHSPRAASCLNRLLRVAGITSFDAEVLGLSPACLAPLAGLGPRARAAAHPRERDLLALLTSAPSPALGKPPAPR